MFLPSDVSEKLAEIKSTSSKVPHQIKEER